MKRQFKLIAILLIMLFILPTNMTAPVQTAEAKTTAVKLSKTTLSLEVGKTYTLKVTGTTKKVTWLSSKKAIATVSSKGKVKAVAIGTATISATIGSKKLTCRVTVKEPANPYLKDAPFDAVEMKIENFSIVVPEKWEYTMEDSDDNSYSLSLHPDKLKPDSLLGITIYATGEKAPVYTIAKKEFQTTITPEFLKGKYAPLEVDIINFKQSDFKTKSRTIFKTEYTVTSDSAVDFNVVQYDFFIDDYLIDVCVKDPDKLGIQAVAEYMMNSIIVK